MLSCGFVFRKRKPAGSVSGSNSGASARCPTPHERRPKCQLELPRPSPLAQLFQDSGFSTSAICWDGRLSVEVVGGTISI